MKRRFYTAISGLDMKIDRLQVGNVTFVRSHSQIPEDTLAQKAFSKLMATTPDDLNLFECMLKDKFTKCAIAVIDVEADDEKTAEEVSEDEIEKALNVLRFYLAGLSENDPFFYKMFIGIEGITNTGLTATVIIDDDNQKFFFSSSRKGAHRGYELDSTKYQKMLDFHFERVSAILATPEDSRSQMENSILTSIIFFGSGMNERLLRNTFVSFVIALESCLLRRCEKDKSGNIANGMCAMLQIKPEYRRAIHEKVESYYDIRSDIVHEGVDNVVEGMVFEICYLTFNTIMRLVAHSKEIKDKDELRKKIREELKEINRKTKAQCT
ncbi:HEPN domain-containing protein [Nitrososphaera viennensis]|uniref:HEPN domain-containing protein n=1 Tax=Nitrososphaera viennensis TaxID=1034015 RepID=A0A977IE75_9ARCH|nr:HEPN domain-containing protein [Nitrososphaera viennensis]UVS69098.1 HEPN domain-containing protein [Nitrososphaera viennensis]